MEIHIDDATAGCLMALAIAVLALILIGLTVLGLGHALMLIGRGAMKLYDWVDEKRAEKTA